MPVENLPSFYFKNTENNIQTAQNNNAATAALQKSKNQTDNFTKQGLSTGAKVAIGAGIVAAAAGVIYLFKSGKGKKIVEKGKEIINSVKSSIKKEKIELPKNGKYDMSKEAPVTIVNGNDYVVGFQPYFANSNGIYQYKTKLADEVKSESTFGSFIFTKKNAECMTKEEKLLYKLNNNGKYGVLGITDGHAYVRYSLGPEGISSNVGGFPDYHDHDWLTHFVLISPDKNFTPAQKNLLTLAQQGKFTSKNAPQTMIFPKKLKLKDIYDIIGKWSQDIDVTSKESEKFLGRLKILKEGERSFLDFSSNFKIDKINK